MKKFSCAALVLLLSAGALPAQDLRAAEDLPATLTRALNACFLDDRALARVESEAFVKLAFGLGPGGEIVAGPDLIEPRRANTDERRLLRLGSEAIMECFEADPGARNVQVVATFRASGVEVEIQDITVVSLLPDEAAPRADTAPSVEAARETLSQLRAASTEDKRRLALLSRQVAELRKQLQSLQAALDVAEAKDFASQVQVQAMGTRLNTALARVAAQANRLAELEAELLKSVEAEAQDLRKVRSDFFARRREILRNVPGVRIEGDRFVFASEVLFPIGSADLSAEGRRLISRVAAVIREAQLQIPDGIDWILRVDGHTDRTGDEFVNWQLSQARALSVVRYMIANEAIDPRRLSANGFGEYQPVDPGSSPEALARNRRIELTFTER